MSDEIISAEPQSPKKVTVTLQLDAEVMRWFMKQSNNNNDCYDHINESLRAYMESKQRQQIKIAHIEQIKRQLAKKGFG
jgi:hypothetical protein